MALLLNISGEEFKIYLQTLCDTGTTYEHARDKLNECFKPKQNIAFERRVQIIKARRKWNCWQFYFVIIKTVLAVTFQKIRDDMIRDQVVASCRSTVLRKKLLAGSLMLSKVWTISRTYKMSDTHACKIKENNISKQTGEINWLTRHTRWIQSGQLNTVTSQSLMSGTYQLQNSMARGSNQRPRFIRTRAECYWCGGKSYYGRECTRAKNAICRDCKRKGRFACVCKMKACEYDFWG